MSIFGGLGKARSAAGGEGYCPGEFQIEILELKSFQTSDPKKKKAQMFVVNGKVRTANYTEHDLAIIADTKNKLKKFEPDGLVDEVFALDDEYGMGLSKLKNLLEEALATDPEEYAEQIKQLNSADDAENDKVGAWCTGVKQPLRGTVLLAHCTWKEKQKKPGEWFTKVVWECLK